jgi:hypothetical protein
LQPMMIAMQSETEELITMIEREAGEGEFN